MIAWEKLDKVSSQLCMKIAKRYVEMCAKCGAPKADMLDVEMDVSAAHIDTPMRLNELLEADDFNFRHDVVGIRKHINRNTGKLENCFVPRFAR